MPTQQIPHYEWSRFFDEFSRQHQAWLATIEMMGRDIGHQVQVRNLPLEGIFVEPNEIGEDDITIIAGAQPDAHISHTITSPRRVWLKQNDEGADEAVEIESFAGVALVSFRATALAEMLNGVRVRRAAAE
jgi:Family of unknown function (DUF5335)